MSSGPTDRNAAPGRRAASWFNAVVLGFALTACAVLAVIITTRKHEVFDRTATREHELSPRTKQILSRVDRDLHLVVAADVKAMDRATYQRTVDVLEKFQRSGGRGGGGPGRLKVDLIQTSDPTGQATYERVLAELVQRDKALIDESTAKLLSCAARAEGAMEVIDRVQQGLERLADQAGSAAGGRLSDQYLKTEAATLRVAIQNLQGGAGKVKAALSPASTTGQAPSIDAALADLKPPVNEASQALGQITAELEPVSVSPDASEQEKAAVGAVLSGLRGARDATGALSADLEAVQVPRVLKIARGLQLRQAALLIDEGAPSGTGTGVIAIDADTLLAVGGEGVDLRARTEDLIAGAVVSLTSGIRPIVCVVHGAPKRLASADWPMFQRVRQQLSMRGIELVEWPVVLEREMPASVAVDSPSRPVVFVTVTAGGGTRDTPQSLAAGIAAFSKALDSLVSSGRNVLVSVNLSNVPATGSPDPLTECLKPLGVEVDSGRPLLQSEKVDTRTVARPQIDILDPHSSHPVAAAVKGLRLRLRWPVTINASSPAAGVRVEPIVSVPASGDGSLWTESEWQEYYRLVGQLKGDYTRIANPPTKDSPRDGSAPGATWTLAMAVENETRDHPRQRLVVVGANGWFLDDLTDAQGTVDGRPVTFFPGNLQLLESSVHWLAGQDDQILRGATAAATPTIPALSGTQQAWLRWLLIAIMPALALAAGVVYRVLRP